MMGLLVKDLKLIKIQRKFFITIFVLMAVFTMLDYDLSFIVSYPTFMCALIVISTISYDDFNHGITFLMTLPTSRKEYVQEKYLLGFMITFIVWLIATLACTLFQMYTVPHFDSMTWVITCGVVLCVPLIFLAVVLPIQLKYGSEKGRIVMVLVIGATMAMAFLLVKGLNYLHIDFVQIISTFSEIHIFLFAIIVMFITFAISYFISITIIKNKEF